jgi:hypothetical protein
LVSAALKSRIRLAEKKLLEKAASRPILASLPSVNPSSFPADPVGYARQLLGVQLTPDQQEILRHLLIPPCRVLVPSGHNTGKTFVAAVAVNWWYDSFNPGLVLTTAPTERDVVDLLWTEVRLQRLRAGLPTQFIGARSPEMRTGDEHYAKGFTARKGESFQGRHRRRMLFVKDEANGVDPIYWETTRSMFDPSLDHAELAIFNPTDTTSQAYLEDHRWSEDEAKSWHRFRLSALNHPNVLAELAGGAKPIPGAVSLRQVNEWVKEWCEPVALGDHRATDVQWPPGSGVWVRPGPIFQSRAMGCWPDTGTGVWGDALFDACVRGPCPAWPLSQLPEIGCDTSMGKGDDFFSISAHWGPASWHHEASNTMDAVRIYGRLKEVAQLAAELANSQADPAAEPVQPQQIRICIDDDGTGNAVAALLRRDRYNVIAVGAGTTASRPELYPNKRSELWFSTVDRAKGGGVYLGRLSRVVQHRLRQQLLAPSWDLDSQGRRVVEPKADTKEKIGRSPDDADGLNLSHWTPSAVGAPSQVVGRKVERTGSFPGTRR